MYRHAVMRLRCHACGAEQPLPTGGRLCDRCILAQQIVEHRRRQPLVAWCLWVMVKALLLLAIVVGIVLWLFFAVLMTSLR